MLFITKVRNLLAPSEFFFENEKLPEHHIEQQVGDYFVRFDSSFESLENNGKLHLYIGKAWLNNRFLTSKEIADDFNILKSAEGSFSYLCISPTSISVVRSLTGPFSLYTMMIDGNASVSNDFDFLFSLEKDCELDVNENYSLGEILGTQPFGGDTLIKQISEISRGEILHTDLQGYWDKSFFNKPFKSSDSLLGSINNSLTYYNSFGLKMVLMASGGLDSSLLMYALSSLPVKFESVHVEYTIDKENSESSYAYDTARNLGIDVSTVTWSKEMRNPFAPRRSDDQEDKNVDQSDVFFDLFSKQKCIITGHGGDHVFIQDPSPRVMIDALLEWRPLQAFVDVKKYSRLTGHGMYRSFYSALRSYVRPAGAINQKVPKWLRLRANGRLKTHYMLENIDGRTAKYQHVKNILYALRDTGDPNHPTSRSCCPLVMQGVVGHVLDVPVRDMFTSKYDRILEREEFWKESGLAVAWRRSKNGSSWQLMNELENFYQSHLDLLESGHFNYYNKIDLSEIAAIIKYAFTVGPPFAMSYVFRLLTIESELRRLAQLRYDRHGKAWPWFRPISNI